LPEAGDSNPLVKSASSGLRVLTGYVACVAYERITIDPNWMSGLPGIRDTRVTVSAVLGQLAAERSRRDRTGSDLISLCAGAALCGMFFVLTIFVQSDGPRPAKADRRGHRLGWLLVASCQSRSAASVWAVSSVPR
jgi:hypothetical protein